MKISYIWSKFLKKARGASISNSVIDRSSKVESGSQIINSSFAKHSFCGYDCQILNADIGSFTSIAGGVVMGGGMHPYDWVGMSPVFYEGKDSVKMKFSEHVRSPIQRIEIGNDVWIGERVMIKQGVKIGHGAVVGMGSVVTKDVNPYSIVAGVPAKVIRNRFDDETIGKLLKIEWWNFSDEKLKEHATLFNNVEEFVKKINK